MPVASAAALFELFKNLRHREKVEFLLIALHNPISQIFHLFPGRSPDHTFDPGIIRNDLFIE